MGVNVIKKIPPYAEIAAGFHNGYTPVNKFGANPDVGTTMETIWTCGGLYDWAGVDAAAGIVKLSSGSADDTSAGTGARTVTIYGLSTAGVEQSESMTLNGQTGVNSVKSYSRVNRIIVNTAGSGGVNAGIIYIGTGTITTGVPAVVWACIDPEMNQTLMAVYTVPAGKTFYMTRVVLSTNSNKGAELYLFVRPSGEIFQVKDASFTFSDTYEMTFDFPLKFEAGCDVDIRAKASAVGASFGARVSGWIE